MKVKHTIFLFFTLLMLWTSKAHATHLRAGEIIVKRVNCNALTFEITVVIYTDTQSSITFGSGYLRLGDGTRNPDNPDEIGVRSPTISNTDVVELGPDIGKVEWTYTHTYGAPGRYVISYYEVNRNADILNIANSVNTAFFIEAEINIDPFLGCNNSPVMLIPPIDQGCPGVAFFHNPGAFDPDGDSLSFEMVIPKKDRGAFVDAYRDPIGIEFFNQLLYLNEDQTGPPSISIDPVTGLLTWDAPGDLLPGSDRLGRFGEYNVAFKIQEWRKIQGEWYPLGYVIRDMQIVIRECENDKPELVVPEEICVEAGTLIDEEILGLDQNFDIVKIESFSEVYFLPSNPASYTPNDGSFQSTLPPNDTASVRFQWQTDCNHVRSQPYQVVFKITDDPDNGPKLVNFATVTIYVLGPKPIWSDAQLDFASRSVDLTWDSYPCLNAETIEIWRRVDSFDYQPDECETGMPDFLGYRLIDTVNPVSTSYTDNNRGRGLDVGAEYCYRLVANYGEPFGGESILSEEICITPVPAEAPIITHVTIDVTDGSNGEITVSWKKPFDLNEVDFGTDYRYSIQRAVGLDPAESNYVTVASGIADTTYTDTGINTETVAYSYRIVLFSNDAAVVGPNDPIDTSSAASSVSLGITAEVDRITLFWIANTPWSNFSQDYPWHYIYRGLEGDGEQNLELIDSVNITASGFSYIDTGQYNDEPLSVENVYCYYIVTQGTYGNPLVDEPLLNKSQMICVQPADDVPPCAPAVEVSIRDCEAFLTDTSCDFSDFNNELTWEPYPTDDCQRDIVFYEIYVAEEKGGDFFLLESVTDTFYIDDNLSSFARCYQVRAIDRSGNAGPFSDVVCFDNCPYYELPNTFTPSVEDGCNDVFSAYSDRTEVGEGFTGDCLPFASDIDKCARFVEFVRFTVVNRWGKEVYYFESNDENPIYIDWNGKGSNGQLVSPGVYYYIAEVTFDVVDPANAVKEFKGWIQIW